MQLSNSKSPWLTMWTSPRTTVDAVAKHKPQMGLFWLSILYGLPVVLQIAQTLSLGMKFQFIPLLLGCMIAAPIVGYIGISVASLLLLGFGRLVKGEGSFQSIRAAFAWSNVPNIGTLFGWGLLLVRFHAALFVESFGKNPFTGSELWIATSAFLLQAIFSTWSLILLIFSLAQVQRISVMRAIGNLLMPFILLLVLSWLLMGMATQ